MRAVFDHTAVVEHDHLVGVDDRRQAVGNHEGRAADQRLRERPLHGDLALAVEVRGGFVQDHDLRLLQEQACDRQACLLTTGEPVAAIADDGVEAVG